jgi:hypothetical protein
MAIKVLDYNDPRYGVYTKALGDLQIRNETAMHTKLSRVGCKNILRLHTFADRGAQKNIWMYMDYAPGGGLDTIQNIYFNRQEYISSIPSDSP